MLGKKELILPGYILICTNIIFPWNRFDPIVNTRVFLVIGITPLLILTMIQNYKNILNQSRNLPILIFAMVMVAQMNLSFFFSKSNKSQQFYGVPLHEIGLLAVLCILIYLLYFASLQKLKNAEVYSNAFLISGIIGSTYGLLQYFKLDPIEMNLFENVVTANQGNPNFTSSFFAITLGLALTRMFEKKKKIHNQIFFTLLICVNIFLIFKTQSLQGLVIGPVLLAISLMYEARFKFKKKFNPIFKKTVIGVIIFIFFYSLPLIHKIMRNDEGYAVRLDFWHVAVDMIKENIFFGVGFDSFADNYFKYATKIPTGFSDSDTLVNSPHNYIFEFAANSGVLLGLTFLSLQIYILCHVVKFLLFNVVQDYYKLSIVLIWIGVNLQSLISPTNIVFLLWFAISSGIILSWNLNKRHTEDLKITNNVKLIRLSAMYLGLLLAYPNLNASIAFSRSVEGGRVDTVLKSIYQPPLSIDRLNSISRSLTEIGDHSNSIKVARFAAEKFPRNPSVWKIIVLNQHARLKEKEAAVVNLRVLDPFFAAKVSSN